jgi:hypothetical protein
LRGLDETAHRADAKPLCLLAALTGCRVRTLVVDGDTERGDRRPFLGNTDFRINSEVSDKTQSKHVHSPSQAIPARFTLTVM